jgi:dephospho-CoA kinase
VILRVGLTGGIASGKSTVARFMREMGCIVVDADDVVRELYRPGRDGHTALVKRYGPGIRTTEGEIDRPKLSSIALSTPEGAADLNTLIHPLVVAEETRRMDEADRAEVDLIGVAEATLLFESGGLLRYDRIVVVDVDPRTQIERAVARGMDRAEAELRMSRQIDRASRLAHADYVISTEGSLADTHKRTAEVCARLRADLDEKRRLGNARRGQ